MANKYKKVWKFIFSKLLYVKQTGLRFIFISKYIKKIIFFLKNIININVLKQFKNVNLK